MPRNGPETSSGVAARVAAGGFAGFRTGPGLCLGILLLVGVTGCPPRPRVPLDPIPMDRAIGRVNANTSRIKTCLKAEGWASGYFYTNRGRRYPFDLPHTSLQVIAPRHLYLSAKSGLLTEEMMLGSNDQKYWLHVRQDDDTYRFGTHAALEDQPVSSIPLRPDQLIEALGLNGLPQDTVGPDGPVQRIVDEYQQLVWLAYADDDQGWIEKEYWLERYEPRMIRRILFRDAMGRVVMRSQLDEYKAMGGDGPLLPHRVRVEWPQADGTLNFRINRWKPMPERKPDHPAFVAPHDRGMTYTNEIDLDTDLLAE
ncbi:MAG TPA: hypothetical protein VM243_17540 [Phycisphaerae bacterium]|nr:hypothetical protein [Phycisphaerae bacterium]